MTNIAENESCAGHYNVNIQFNSSLQRNEQIVENRRKDINKTYER